MIPNLARSKYVIVGLLAIIVAVIFLIFTWGDNVNQEDSSVTPFIGSTFQTVPIVEQEEDSSLMVVHYTEQGFAPADIKIKQGSLVRFTNDTNLNVRVRAAGQVLYPGPGGCSESAFDSCTAIVQGGSWELRFEEAGLWTYWNENDHDDKGVVRVL